jgi:uncharacterized protein YabE (DUF348 family)
MRRKIKRIKSRYIAAQHRHVRTIKRIGRKPLFTVPIATFMVLLTLIGVAFLVTSRGGDPRLLRRDNPNVVLLNYDKQERTIPTDAKTVGDLLERLHIHLNEGDVVEPGKNTEIIGDNFRVNVYRAVPVTIVDGGKKTFVYSAAATPRSIAKQAGVTVYPEDRLDLLPTEDFLTESSIGERVVIQRSYPINMEVYGRAVSTRTLATTVGGLLEEKHIKLVKGDSVFPDAKTALQPGGQVFILNKSSKIETAEEEIPMPVETTEDNSLSFGITVVRQQGAPGKQLVTYKVDETGQKVKVQEVVIQAAVKQIVAKGTYFNISRDKTAVMAAAGIPQSSFVYADYVIEHESHWNPAALNSRGCAGLGQACPGSKLAAACPSWRTDPVCQMHFFNKYAVDRYGGWAGAYNAKKSKGWW